MTPPAMVDLRGKLPANGAYARRDLDGVTTIVIHHVGVDEPVTPEAIARFHVGLGWPGAGYCFYVRKDGTIYQLQDLTVMSYHVAGRNLECVGICLEGDFTKRKPGEAQIDAANGLIAWLLAGSLKGRQVVGHGEIALRGEETSCPGRTMEYIKRG